MSAVIRYGLSGVTVHWTEPSFDCRGPDEQSVLKILLRRLHASIKSLLPAGLVTVILEPGAANELFAHDAADAVDHFFLTTQRVVPSDPTNLGQFCETVTRGMHAALPATRWCRRSAEAAQISTWPDRQRPAFSVIWKLRRAEDIHGLDEYRCGARARLLGMQQGRCLQE
ncbi:hypothetical protein MRX96_056166 [Rhipicephalus microplus]